jgi:hypothetical protein
MPDLMCDLQDGEETAAEHPDTFWMPPAVERWNCTLGDLVQIIFRNRHNARSERMWLEIVEILDRRYRGRLRNLPLFIELDPDVEVEFGPEHVIDIRKAEK